MIKANKRILALAIAASISGLFTDSVAALDLPAVDREADAVLLKQELHSVSKATAATRVNTPARTRWMDQSLPASKSGWFWSAEGLARAHLAQLQQRSTKALRADQLQFQNASSLPGGAEIVQFKTTVHGIEVFRRSVRMLIDAEQKLRFLSGQLPEYSAQSSKAGFAFVLSARDALAVALTPYGFDPDVVSSLANESSKAKQTPYRQLQLDADFHGSNGNEIVQSARAKQVLFPLGKQLLPAWYVETVVGSLDSTDADYYAQVIDANTGELLYRHNQTQDAAFKWNVWAEAAPSYLPYPGPHGRGYVPHPAGTPDNTAPPTAAPNLISLQSLLFSQNDPWLPDAATVTTGNNAEACADIAGGDGCDASDVRAPVFPASNAADPPAYDLSLAPNASTQQREAAVRQMFYMVNWIHDWYYDAGFDEASGNAQTDNFGRGGLDNDSISAEGQDSSGTNNANMSTPSDGGRPSMQMYTFSAGSGLPAPDGTLDGGIMAHELGHYISNRLVEDANGLITNHSGGMGEGYGDFHALLFSVKEEDGLLGYNPNFSGAYAFAGYTFYPQDNTAFFYGLRRYPYSTDFNINPLTLGHIVNGVALPATPAPSFGASGANNAEVHNAGEVWASMLWQCYAGLINDTPRLTFAEAQQRMKEYLIAGYKLTPAAPVMTEARDAILSVMASTDMADFVACSAGFAARGAGIDAAIPNRYSSSNTGTVENFDDGGRVELAVNQTDDDATCDNDGILDEGEAGTLSIDWRNRGWKVLGSSALTISSDHAGLTFSGAASANINPPSTNPYADTVLQVPMELATAPVSGTITLTLTPADPEIAAPTPVNAVINVNYDQIAASSVIETFDTSIFAWNTRLTDGATSGKSWAVQDAGGGVHQAHADDFGSIGVAWIETPDIVVGNSGFSVTLHHRYQFEDDGTHYDAGVVEISTNGGISWNAVDGTPSIYNGTISNCCNNPMANRQGLVDQSAGYPAYVDTTLNLGNSYDGQTIRLRFGMAEDEAAGGYGWDIDSVSLTGASNLPFPSISAQAQVCSGGVNNPPTANDDAVTIDEDDAGSVIDVLGNDSFAPDSGETLTVTAVTQPVNGTVTFNAGDATYLPHPNFNGIDAFTYTIGDGNGGTDTATVNVTVTAVNDAPITVGSIANRSDAEGTTVSQATAASFNDVDAGDSLTYSATGLPTGLSINTSTGEISGTLDFTANAGSPFSVSVTVTDGADIATQNFSWAVTDVAQNSAPSFDAGGYAFAVVEQSQPSTYVGSVSASDVDFDPLTFAITAGNAAGVFAIDDGNGAIRLSDSDTSALGAAGTVHNLTLSVDDGNGGSDSATVSITVQPSGIFADGFED